MTHCNNGHPEILHYEDACPLCSLLKSSEEAKGKLTDEITQLKGTIEDQDFRIDELRRCAGI